MKEIWNAIKLRLVAWIIPKPPASAMPGLKPGQCECSHVRCAHVDGAHECKDSFEENGVRFICACQVYIRRNDDDNDDDSDDGADEQTPSPSELERIYSK